MDTISAFQQKYPLSSKKFFKKIAADLIGYLFYALIITGSLVLACFVLWIVLNPNLPLDLITWPWIVGGLLAYVVVYAVLVSLRAWYIKVYIKRYYYSGEEHYITIKKGVFAPSEIHVQYQKIQDVYVDQDIFDRILGIYDVHIASATSTSGIEAHIDGVDKEVAEGLKNFLLNSMRDGNSQSASNKASAVVNEQPATSSTPKFQLTEEVSSEKYPLTNKWFVSSLIVMIFSTLIGYAVFSLFFVLPGKNGNPSLASQIGFDNIALGLFVLFVISIIWRTISLLLLRKNYSFKFDTDMIYYKRGVLTLQEKHMPYSSIQDVKVSQGVIYRMLGIADVIIENAASRQIMVNNRPQSIPDTVILEGLDKADANRITELLKGITLSSASSKMGL